MSGPAFTQTRELASTAAQSASNAYALARQVGERVGELDETVKKMDETLAEMSDDLHATQAIVARLERRLAAIDEPATPAPKRQKEKV